MTDCRGVGLCDSIWQEADGEAAVAPELRGCSGRLGQPALCLLFPPSEAGLTNEVCIGLAARGSCQLSKRDGRESKRGDTKTAALFLLQRTLSGALRCPGCGEVPRGKVKAALVYSQRMDLKEHVV